MNDEAHTLHAPPKDLTKAVLSEVLDGGRLPTHDLDWQQRAKLWQLRHEASTLPDEVKYIAGMTRALDAYEDAINSGLALVQEEKQRMQRRSRLIDEGFAQLKRRSAVEGLIHRAEREASASALPAQLRILAK